MYRSITYWALANIKVANAELDKLKTAIPSREKFYELTRSCLKTINSTRDLLELDAVLNEVVLNLRAGDDVVSVIKLNKPYDMLVDLSKISLGRVQHMLLKLFKYIIKNPCSSEKLLDKLKLSLVCKPKLIENPVL